MLERRATLAGGGAWIEEHCGDNQYRGDVFLHVGDAQHDYATQTEPDLLARFCEEYLAWYRSRATASRPAPSADQPPPPAPGQSSRPPAS